MSSEEKRRLGTALTQLSPDDLNKALLIVAQNNPNFQATAEEVDLDIDAQVILFLSQFSLSNISIPIKHPRYDYILDFLSSFFLFLWVTNRTKDILTKSVHLLLIFLTNQTKTWNLDSFASFSFPLHAVFFSFATKSWYQNNLSDMLLIVTYLWQSETTLWRLKFFIKEALKITATTGDNKSNHHHHIDTNERKRGICDAIATTSQKRSKKLPY